MVEGKALCSTCWSLLCLTSLCPSSSLLLLFPLFRLLNFRCHGLDLTSFLIMPVQRVPRYRMLIEEIVKQTPPDHPDMQSLATALEKVGSVG